MLATVFETSSEAVKDSIIGKSLSIKPLIIDLKVPTRIIGHAKLGHANSHPVTAARSESQFIVQSILQCMSTVHESSQDSKVQLL